MASIVVADRVVDGLIDVPAAQQNVPVVGLTSVDADLRGCRPDAPQPPVDPRLRPLLATVAEPQLPLAPPESLVTGNLRGRGVSLDSLNDGQHRDALRAGVLLQVDRCRHVLRSGPELVGELRGWTGIGVGGFVAGALATVDAIGRRGGEVCGAVPRLRRLDLIGHVAWLLPRGRRVRA